LASEYRTVDWDTYRMDMHAPQQVLEPEEAEVSVVDGALAALVTAGILATALYDREYFALHRRAVAEQFDIPWTAITPRMQRLLYAINAIARPRNMVAAGVFCGNTFVSNAGAAVGPGAVYQAEQLVGIEIVAAEAERAERNVRLLDPTGVARVVAADALDVVAAWQGAPIDLLYLDADGAGGRGKGIYLDILETAWPHLAPDALILAHNSINCATRLADYLRFVRDPAHLRASVNVYMDCEGLEVSRR
jgi:predicted O-methyltransferase YrrM